MAKITVPVTMNNLTTSDPSYNTYLSQLLGQIQNILNGHVSLTDNCQTQIVSAQFHAANANQGFPHTLNKIPSGYILVGAAAATNIYNGTQANTVNTIYLQSTVATSASVLVF